MLNPPRFRRVVLTAALAVALPLTSTTVPSVPLLPAAVAQTQEDKHLATADDNGDGTWTLKLNDGTPIGTVGSTATMSGLKIEDGKLIILGGNGDPRGDAIDLHVTTPEFITGEDGANKIVFKDQGTIVATLDVVDTYLKEINTLGGGRYELVLTQGDPVILDINDDVQGALDKAVKKIMESMNANSANSETEIRAEIAAKMEESDAQVAQRIREINEKLKLEMGRLNNRVDELKECAMSPHIAVPAVIALTTLLAALSQSIPPSVLAPLTQALPKLPSNPQVDRFAADARGVAAAGIGIAGLVSLFFIPGLCDSPSLAKQGGVVDEDIDFGSSQESE